ncbi:MAG: hypothetical protein ACOC6B_03560 [Thermodesulfobacteriota bacterium]
MDASYQRPHMSFGGPLTRAVKAMIITCTAVFFYQFISQEITGRSEIAYIFGLVPVLVWKRSVLLCLRFKMAPTLLFAEVIQPPLRSLPHNLY